MMDLIKDKSNKEDMSICLCTTEGSNLVLSLTLVEEKCT